ncbi:tetratricopeptide (TPR) repeat protein [Kitasatospora sp. MAA19]|uniref:ATP-binding protein n=1 Tax=Kitasatospora sp. MAA19 TaxID=3035090 RepID=UPI002474D2ED|nr:ATP-binding protein [Kitasatospora sp. MAA19]MDH6708643.1 tetratricopeptide (TPR) repeat protein [Kitasatospora sp. MAA19]
MEHHRVANTVSGTVGGHVVQAENIGSVHIHPRPEPPPRPHQVRSPYGPFVNREPEFAALSAALGRVETGGLGIVVFTGLGGVGKTELIAKFTEEHRARFPDGDLYADLQAYRHQGGVDLPALLAGFLRALGTEPPAVETERFTTFRTVTAERRCLFFLDNVEHAAEVRALLPSCGLVVVASRRRLPALRTVGAEVRQLGPLSATAGADLVRAWLGSERGTDGELAALVELCGGLPLALNAVGSQLLDRDNLPLGRVVAELHDREGRVAVLHDEESDLGPTYDLVYERLSPQGRALYHLIGVHPGPFVSAELARAAGVEQAGAALTELRAVHLLDEVVDDGLDDRFRAHDVVRLHAYDRTRELPGRVELLARVVAYFRGRASLADRAMGARLRLQDPSGEGLPGFASYPEALEWLQAERANLRAAVEAAAKQKWHGEVWRLCESLWPLYHGRKHYQDLIATHRLGVTSAQWDNRPDAVVRMRNQLARAHFERKEYALAAEQLEVASELVPLVTDQRVVGVLYETDGLLCLADGRSARAAERFALAREANRGDRHGEIVQSYNLAQALIADDRPEQALAVLDEATARAEEPERDTAMLVKLPLVRARAYRALGRLDLAVAQAEECARLASGQREYAKAAQAYTLLVALAEELEDAELAEHTRERLRQLRG